MTTKTLKQKVQVVTIAENQLLLLEFAKGRGEGFQSVTGSVEYDESFLEAARRELVEEIGVSDNVIDVNFTFNFHDRYGEDVEEKVFLFNPKKIPEIHISEEHQSYKWVPVNQVSVKNFAHATSYEAFLKALEFV